MINKIENYKSYAIIALVIGLFFTAVIVVSLIVSSRKKTPEDQKPQITGAMIPQPEGFQNEIEKLQSQLPLEGPNYIVKYKQTLNLIEVEITAENKDEYLKTKALVETELKLRDITDICNLNIFWVPKVTPAVYESIEIPDMTTQGCKVIPN